MAISKQVLDDLLGDRNPNEVFTREGLLDDLKKALVERILDSELDEHLEKDRGSGKSNRRNEPSPKTVRTDTSKVPLDIPRDRSGTFDPQPIAKYQRRFPGFDDKIVSMYARGMTVREIQGRLEDVYGVDASSGLISRITDTVADAVKEWLARPPEACCPLIFFDAVRVKIRDEGFVRNEAVYSALGIQPDGAEEVLGVWIERTEGAKFRMRVMTELKNRGVADIPIAVVDGLKGFPDAITAVFPKPVVRTCIVHLIRASMSFASPIRAVSLPRPTSSRCWPPARSRSAWMEKGPGATTSSSSASGGPSNMRRSTCAPMPTCVSEARARIGRYLSFYNSRRPHSSLDGKPPNQAYFNQPMPAAVAA